MTTRRIIPDAYTEYEDGHLGVVPPSLANVEAKIGAAEGGQPGKVYTLSGPDAKNMAKTIFKGGPLLHAIEEAFDSGSTRIHAVRIGSANRASIVLKDVVDNDTLRIKSDYGSSGNNHYLNVGQQLDDVPTGYLVLVSGLPPDTPHRVIFYDSDLEQLREYSLPAEIEEVADVSAAPAFEQMSMQYGFFVLGYIHTPTTVPKVWRFDENGLLLPDQTLDLSSILNPDEQIRGIDAFELEEVVICTDQRIFEIDLDEPFPPPPGSYWELPFAALGLMTPDIVSAVDWENIAAQAEGQDPPNYYLLLDRTEKAVYAVLDEDGPPTITGQISLAPWTTTGTPEKLAYHFYTGNLMILLRELDNSCRLVELDVDWSAQPTPTVTFIEEYPVASDSVGLHNWIEDILGTTKITIQDRNQSPAVVRTYEGQGNLLTATSAVAQAINDGGVYEAELLTDPAFILMPSENDEEEVDPSWFVPFMGGSEGGDPTNGDYLAGLAATKSKTDTAWIHAVGANTNALWTAILLHCNEMFELHHAERFAILETPEFSTTHDEGSAEYLSDLQDYVDDIAEMMEVVGDRNAVVFAGGAGFMDSDGNEYARPVTDSCGGTMAGLEVQKSLINKPVRNIIQLIPEFSPGHIQSLIQARVNCLRFKPGRGFIIAHSLTAAATGSDYSRVNDLRAVYYGSKAAREAAQPYVGEENDAAGEGLRRLESAMSRPLEQMRDAGQIDSFDLSAVSTENDRLLGDVYVSLGIQPRRAMEMIYTTVYLK